jgi:hypothetical protein
MEAAPLGTLKKGYGRFFPSMERKLDIKAMDQIDLLSMLY